MDNIDNIIDKMVDLLKIKNNKLLDILELTNKQSDAINSQDDGLLNMYIDQKQTVIDRIDEIDQVFLGHFNTLKTQLGIDSLDEIPAGKADGFKALKNEVNNNHKVIEQIISKEKENNIKIKAEYDDIKSKIKEISSGKKLTSAYEHRNTLADGVFIDKKK